MTTTNPSSDQDPNRRQVLLPPYMDDVEAWKQLIEVVDEVFTYIDDSAIWLGKLRDSWLLTPGLAQMLTTGDVLTDNTGFEMFERDILIRQANMLGFKAEDPSVLTDEDYQRIVRYLPSYWYGQGTNKLADFIGFILDIDITIDPLWSQDTGLNNGLYGGFATKEEAGLPVWKEGGTWFPTTHVRIRLPPARETSNTKQKVEQLFNALSNYNLVLHSVDQDHILDIHSSDEERVARIVVLEAIADQTQDIPTQNP